MTLKQWLLQLIEKLDLMGELIDQMPLPPEAGVVDTKITALLGKLTPTQE